MPEDEELVVHECEDDGDHQWQVGEEVLAPWLGDIEDDHRYHVDIVDEQEEDIGLQPQEESTFSIKCGDIHFHAPVLPIVVAVGCLEDSDEGDLASHLDAEGGQHRHQVGEAEERAPRLLDAQLCGSLGVADEDDEEEVEAEVPVEVLEVSGVLQVLHRDDSGGVLDKRVDGHDVEEREVGRQSRPALLYQLYHRGNVGRLRGEGRRDGSLRLRQRKPDVRLLQCPAIVGPIAAHRHLQAHFLEGHHDFGLVVWFGTGEHRHTPHEFLFDGRQLDNAAGEELIEGPAGYAELAAGEVGLADNGLHKGRGGIVGSILVQHLQLDLTRALQLLLDLQLLVKHLAAGWVFSGAWLSAGFSGARSIFVKMEVFFCEFVVNKVADDHALGPVGDVALVTDVGASERVVTRYHHAADLSSLQSGNGSLCLWLQLVLKHLETVENQLFFGFGPADGLDLCIRYGFAGDGKDSEAVRGVLAEYLVVIGRDGFPAHDGCQHLRRAFSVHLMTVGDAVPADHAHALQVGVELEAPENHSAVSALALEGEDDVWVGVRLVEGVPAEEEGLDLHGVANEFLSCFYLDDGVVSGHVGEGSVEEGELGAVLEHYVDVGFVVDDCGVETCLISRHECVEVHEILGEGAGLVEAAELDHTTSDHLVLGHAEDPLLLQSLDGVDDAEGHAHWQGRRHGDSDQVEELQHEVLCLNVLVDEDNHHDESSHRQAEEEEQVLGGLPLEGVLLLLGEEDDADQLPLRCHEVRTHHIHWYSEGLPEGLELAHFLLIVDLDDGGALEYESVLVDGQVLVADAFEGVGLLDDGHGLAGERALVDKCAALEDDALEGDLDGVFEEDDIAGHDVNGGEDLYLALAQHVNGDLVVGHAEYLVVELDHLVEADGEPKQRHEEQCACEIVVLRVECPVQHTEKQEQVEWTQDLLDGQVDTTRLLYHHCPLPVGVLQLVRLRVAEPALLPPPLQHVGEAIAVVVHTDPYDLVLVDDVVHVAVDEICVEAAVLVIHHEDLLFAGNNAGLLVVVDDVEVCCLCQPAELVIEHALCVRKPSLSSPLPESHQPRYHQQDVRNQEEGVSPPDELYR